jgi:parallel beta-helix repeat protein
VSRFRVRFKTAGPIRSAKLLTLLLMTGAAVSVASIGGHVASRAACSKVAAPYGSDHAAGTAARPFRTADRLARSLRAGDIGCLRAGIYRQDLTISRSGSGRLPIILRGFPGQHATLVGRLSIPGSHVTILRLRLEGTSRAGPSSPTVTGTDVAFDDDDVTSHHTAGCFSLGKGPRQYASRAVIRGSRIHDCGRLPHRNSDPAISVQNANDTLIVRNLIYDNAGSGIQLSPSAERTIVSSNIIVGNREGVVFGGGSRRASNDNLVEHNVITDSRVRNVGSRYAPGARAGIGNVAVHNCTQTARQRSGIQFPEVGFSAWGNVVADPKFVDRRSMDFRLRRDSPCRVLLRGQVTDTHTPGDTGATGYRQLVQPPFRPTSTVTARTPAQFARDLARLKAGEELDVHPMTLTGSFLITKALRSYAEIHFAPGVTFSGAEIHGYSTFQISRSSKIRIYGGDVTNPVNGACVAVDSSTNILWWHFQLHDCSATGLFVASITRSLSGIDLDGEISHVAYAPNDFDPHAEKCTGIHGSYLGGSSSLTLSGKFSLNVRDAECGAALQAGSNTVNTELWVKADDISYRARRQTAGNAIQFWGTGLHNITVHDVVADDLAGRVVETGGLYSCCNSGIVVEHGRGTNTLQNPLLSRVNYFPNPAITYRDAR